MSSLRSAPTLRADVLPPTPPSPPGRFLPPPNARIIVWVVPLRPTTTRVVLKVVMPLISVSVDGPSFRRGGERRFVVRRYARVLILIVRAPVRFRALAPAA